MEHEFKTDGKLEIIHKNGQPYGIRDARGYLLFFPKVTKYTGQEQILIRLYTIKRYYLNKIKN